MEALKLTKITISKIIIKHGKTTCNELDKTCKILGPRLRNKKLLIILNNKGLFTHNVFKPLSLSTMVIKCVLIIVIRIMEKRWMHHPFCPLFTLSHC